MRKFTLGQIPTLPFPRSEALGLGGANLMCYDQWCDAIFDCIRRPAGVETRLAAVGRSNRAEDNRQLKTFQLLIDKIPTAFGPESGGIILKLKFFVPSREQIRAMPSALPLCTDYSPADLSGLA